MCSFLFLAYSLLRYVAKRIAQNNKYMLAILVWEKLYYSIHFKLVVDWAYYSWVVLAINDIWP